MNTCAAGGSNGRKLPFYMMFPFADNLSAEEENEQDMRRIAELYPPEARRLLPQVEEVCDRWEYDGSVMYAHYPDRIWIRREADRIGCETAPEEGTDPEMAGQETRARARLAELLLLQEIYRRRCRRRRFRSHFVY